MDMHSTMLENGLEFIFDATEQMRIYEESSDFLKKRRSLKYSLLHLMSGIELVMKSRLYIENWTYIFSKMEDANRSALSNGTLKSVEYSKCIDRLKCFCDITMSNTDKQAFEDLRQCRNQVEHFYTQESMTAIESKINSALTATVRFLADNYEEFESPSVIDIRKDVDISLSDEEKKTIEKITTAVDSLKSHHQDAVELAIKRAKSIRLRDELMLCPDCKERTLVIADEECDGNCKCYLCGYMKNCEETASDYLERVIGINEYRIVKYGGEFPLYICPSC